MSKRKRGHDGDGEEIHAAHHGLKAQVSRFQAHLELTTRKLVSALKLACVFERQKLGRRQKQAVAQPQRLLKLREEVIVLKQLGLEKTATSHLTRTLRRSKRLMESAVLIELYGSNAKFEPGKRGAEGDVHARLFKSAPVLEAMSGFMDRAYELAGVDQTNKRPHQATKSVAEGSRGDKMNVLHDDNTADLSDDNGVDEGGRKRATSQENSDDEDDPIEQYATRLASSDESNSSDSASKLVIPRPTVQPSHRKQRTQPVPPQGTSSFLPALASSGYYSGSDAGSDGEPDPLMVKPRKNRRGQQERRKIAEKKYGKNARHLPRENARSANGRDDGWDPQRGAIAANKLRGGRFGPTRGRGRGGGQHLRRGNTSGMSNDAEQPAESSATTATGTAHPSWQAAKLRKEQSNPAAAFAGKVTRFD